MRNLFPSLVILVGFASCTPKPAPQEVVEAAPTQEQIVERGRYLVETIGCEDCHSPKVMTEYGPAPDPERRFAGHVEGDVKDKVAKDALANWALFNMSLTAAAGPWGISYAANISSDESGIGTWTDEQFIRAMREGQFKGLVGTRKLLPPMPWPNFAKLTDDDLKAMLAYLKSTKPVQNVVPEPLSPQEMMQ